jgi:hypothetical protein
MREFIAVRIWRTVYRLTADIPDLNLTECIRLLDRSASQREGRASSPRASLRCGSQPSTRRALAPDIWLLVDQ